MKAVVISAVPAAHPSLSAIAQILDRELGRTGYDTVQRFEVTTLKLGYCQGEFDCWVKTPGRCRAHDAEPALVPGPPDHARRFRYVNVEIFEFTSRIMRRIH